jgi:glutamate synthase domain-containing protein 3
MTVDTSSQRDLAVRIDANGFHYRELNRLIQEAVAKGAERIDLHGVHGQRYIATNLRSGVEIHIHGTPGNDLGAFLDGSRLIVYGNAQDGCGNTMNEGEIIVHGHAGDIAGLSARGGRIFIREDVGYRAGIHMKEYEGKGPALVIGGTAQDFLGEYMAGGIVVVLGLTLNGEDCHRARFVGTGMHGGVIYLRGQINDYQLGKEVGVSQPNRKDRAILRELVTRFAGHFGFDAEEILAGRFVKLFPLYLRPYGRLYTY